MEGSSEYVDSDYLSHPAIDWTGVAEKHDERMYPYVADPIYLSSVDNRFDINNTILDIDAHDVKYPLESLKSFAQQPMHIDSITLERPDTSLLTQEYDTQWTQYFTETPAVASSGFDLETKAATESFNQFESAEERPALSSSDSENVPMPAVMCDEPSYPPLSGVQAESNAHWNTHDSLATTNDHTWVSPNSCNTTSFIPSSCYGTSWNLQPAFQTSCGGIPTTICGPNIGSGAAGHGPVANCGTTSRDKSKDEFLLASKAAGMSYKDIKIKGGFAEAESTLRGRYRALTKPKDARVRRPEWAENDVAVLKQIVARHLNTMNGASLIRSSTSQHHRSRAQTHALDKVPWKQVAESMASRGCYRFGNATVKKKYMEVMELEHVSNSQSFDEP